MNSTSEVKETFDSVNKTLNDVCEIALIQHIPGKQLVLMTDASFRSGGYALVFEDDPDQKKQSKRKTYVPWRLNRKSSPLRNSRGPSTRENSWQFRWHFLSLHAFFGKQQSQQTFWQVKNQSRDSSDLKQFHQHCGIHVTMCCNSSSRKHTSPVQSTLPLTLSPD